MQSGTASNAPEGDDTVTAEYPGTSGFGASTGSAPSVDSCEDSVAVTNALAADTSSLYVATFSTVYRFDRATGAEVAQWTLPPINRAVPLPRASAADDCETYTFYLDRSDQAGCH